jgi:uncharacterized protein
MATEDDRVIDLVDDTRLNVASLLQEPVGSTRDLRITLGDLALDDDLIAHNIEATARLTRLKSHILVKADVSGVIPLQCAVCLKAYDQPFAETFTESFRQSVDVRTGAVLPERSELDPGADHEPGFVIDESHQIDLGEAFRQWILLAIPMQPSCGADCPGPLLRSLDPDDAPDPRFGRLAELLIDDEGVAGRNRN